MGMGGGIGFLVGGAGGAMFGAYEIMRCVFAERPCTVHMACADRRLPLACRIRGAQYNQRVGYVGETIAPQTSPLRTQPRDLTHTVCLCVGWGPQAIES